MAGVRLLILLAFVCAFVHCAEISFNTEFAAACAEGCSFFNQSIWDGDVPGANDTVIIHGDGVQTFSIYIRDNNATVGNISLLNAGFRVFSTLTVDTIVINASTFAVTGSPGLVVVGSSLLAVDGSNVTVLGALLDVDTQPANATFEDSQLWVSSNDGSGYFRINGFCTHSGSIQLIFDNSYYCRALALLSSFTAFGSYLTAGQLLINGTDISIEGFVGDYISVRPNSTATIHGEVLWGAQMYLAQGSVLTLMNFPNGTVNINSIAYHDSPPVDGLGTLQILSSQVNITGTGLGQTFPGTLEIGGNTQITATNFATTQISFLPYGIDVNDTTYVTIQGNNLVLGNQVGDGTFNGAVIAYGRGVSFVGDFNIVSGGISASDSSISVNGSLIVQKVGNNTSFGKNVSITVSGQILAELVLDQTSSLVVAGRTTFYGILQNNGLVRASTENPLIIYGSYSQGASGTFYAQVDSNTISPLRLYGNNSLSLDGTLKFTTQQNVFESTTFLVAWSENGTISGTFAGKPVADTQSTIKTTTIAYTPYEVTLKYHITPKDFPHWVWGVVGGGGALILIVIIAIAVKCRRSRRPKYNPIP